LQRAYGQDSQVVLTTPILEGLDGVQKMSKSLGNAIGIHEPPLEMYGKIMSISDEMMWRYYELLTDVQVADIEKMKREMHPMQAKKELARRIVADFHSSEAATKAAEDWAKQFQKDEVPDDVETIEVRVDTIRLGAVIPDEKRGGGATREIKMADSSCVIDTFLYPLRIDKLIRHAGLALSNTEAAGKIRQGAVSIGGEVILPNEVHVGAPIGAVFLLKVGRRMKRVRLIN
jgi:tyrosyl-tRNA synthetase